MFNFTTFPPALPAPSTAALGASTDPHAKTEEYLRDLAWTIYMIGMAAGTADGAVTTAQKDHKLSDGAAKALHTALESFVKVANQVNGFLRDYAGELKSGKWPPVEIGMPPSITFSSDNLMNIMKLVDAIFQVLINALQGHPDAQKYTDLMVHFDKATKGVIKTIDTYYPSLFG